MADQPNIFGYMRISTQEERQKQRYNRQENALSKYAQTHDFRNILKKRKKKEICFRNGSGFYELKTDRHRTS